jgi:hypothetical protein
MTEKVVVILNVVKDLGAKRFTTDVRVGEVIEMYCRVIACDFDGTGASNGRMAPEVSGALEAARMYGIVTMLVTGRVLEDLQGCAVIFPLSMPLSPRTAQ